MARLILNSPPDRAFIFRSVTRTSRSCQKSAPGNHFAILSRSILTPFTHPVLHLETSKRSDKRESRRAIPRTRDFRSTRSFQKREEERKGRATTTTTAAATAQMVRARAPHRLLIRYHVGRARVRDVYRANTNGTAMIINQPQRRNVVSWRPQPRSRRA